MLRPKRRAFLIVHPAADDYGRSILQQRPPCETAGRNALTIWLLGRIENNNDREPDPSHEHLSRMAGGSLSERRDVHQRGADSRE